MDKGCFGASDKIAGVTEHDSGGINDAAHWWAGFEHDPRVSTNSGLRAADRDRDHVLQLLTLAFSDGRLDRVEFDERADAVTAARTLGELTPIVSDLVLLDAPRSTAGQLMTTLALEAKAVATWRADRREAAWTMLMASTICWVTGSPPAGTAGR